MTRARRWNGKWVEINRIPFLRDLLNQKSFIKGKKRGRVGKLFEQRPRKKEENFWNRVLARRAGTIMEK